MYNAFRLLVIAVLLAIVVSLGIALYHLARGSGDSEKMIRALAWRVGLSLGLFALLMVAWYTGLFAPHRVRAPTPPAATTPPPPPVHGRGSP